MPTQEKVILLPLRTPDFRLQEMFVAADFLRSISVTTSELQLLLFFHEACAQREKTGDDSPAICAIAACYHPVPGNLLHGLWARGLSDYVEVPSGQPQRLFGQYARIADGCTPLVKSFFGDRLSPTDTVFRTKYLRALLRTLLQKTSSVNDRRKLLTLDQEISNIRLLPPKGARKRTSRSQSPVLPCRFVVYASSGVETFEVELSPIEYGYLQDYHAKEG